MNWDGVSGGQEQQGAQGLSTGDGGSEPLRAPFLLPGGSVTQTLALPLRHCPPQLCKPQAQLPPILICMPLLQNAHLLPRPAASSGPHS